MKKLIERYVRKKIWKSQPSIPIVAPSPHDYDGYVMFVMEGYPFHWLTRLWAVTQCHYHHDPKEVYEWVFKK